MIAIKLIRDRSPREGASPREAFSVLRELFDQAGDAKVLFQGVDIEAIAQLISDCRFGDQSSLLECGCIEAAVKAMAAHSDNSGLLQVGCLLFVEMFQNDISICASIQMSYRCSGMFQSTICSTAVASKPRSRP